MEYCCIRKLLLIRLTGLQRSRHHLSFPYGSIIDEVSLLRADLTISFLRVFRLVYLQAPAVTDKEQAISDSHAGGAL